MLTVDEIMLGADEDILIEAVAESGPARLAFLEMMSHRQDSPKLAILAKNLIAAVEAYVQTGVDNGY